MAQLPDEIVFHIFRMIKDPINIIKLSMVCPQWNRVSEDEKLWLHLLDVLKLPKTNPNFHFFTYPVSTKAYLSKETVKNNCIKNYLSYCRDIPTIKVVLMGDSKSGKTTLLRAIAENHPIPEEIITPIPFYDNRIVPGICFNKFVRLTIWDTEMWGDGNGGNISAFGYRSINRERQKQAAKKEGEAYDKMRTKTYLNADVFVFCYSMDNKQSLINVEKIWIPEIAKYYQPKDRKYISILCGTKIDILRHHSKNSQEQVNSNNNPNSFYRRDNNNDNSNNIIVNEDDYIEVWSKMGLDDVITVSARTFENIAELVEKCVTI